MSSEEPAGSRRSAIVVQRSHLDISIAHAVRLDAFASRRRTAATCPATLRPSDAASTNKYLLSSTLRLMGCLMVS